MHTPTPNGESHTLRNRLALLCAQDGSDPSCVASTAEAGVMQYDDNGDSLGKVYTLREVCGEIMQQISI
jgi:hypothetical protein